MTSSVLPIGLVRSYSMVVRFAFCNRRELSRGRRYKLLHHWHRRGKKGGDWFPLTVVVSADCERFSVEGILFVVEFAVWVIGWKGLKVAGIVD